MNCNILKDLLRKKELYSTYSYYNKEYENYKPSEVFKEYSFVTNNSEPQLIDMLFSGCSLPFTSSSKHTSKTCIEKDIDDWLKFYPHSLDCNIGRLQCRNYVKPIVAACFNTHVPTHVIKKLLDAGANPNETFH